MPVTETNRGSVAKSVSWRIIAGFITACVAYAMTGKGEFAAKIDIAEA